MECKECVEDWKEPRVGLVERNVTQERYTTEVYQCSSTLGAATWYPEPSPTVLIVEPAATAATVAFLFLSSTKVAPRAAALVTPP